MSYDFKAEIDKLKCNTCDKDSEVESPSQSMEKYVPHSAPVRPTYSPAKPHRHPTPVPDYPSRETYSPRAHTGKRPCPTQNNSKGYRCQDEYCDSEPQRPPRQRLPHAARNTYIKPSQCFRPVCDVVTTLEPGGFPLPLMNATENSVPIKFGETFFWHESAGLMNIHFFQGGAYNVSLVNESGANQRIKKGDCIAWFLRPSEAEEAILSSRCLSSSFTVPQVDVGDSTIYIENGGGLSVGQEIRFTYKGVLGTYSIVSVGAFSGTTYSFQVANTGQGHTVGDIITPDTTVSCDIPIEAPDFLDPTTWTLSTKLDSIAGVFNGTPRQHVAPGPGYALISEDSEGFPYAPAKVTNLDCCVNFRGCLKFNRENALLDEAKVVLDYDIGSVPQCFRDAYTAHKAVNTNLPMNINGVTVAITDFNSTTNQICVCLVDVAKAFENVTLDFVEFDGTAVEMCLGECCDSCITPTQNTDHKLIGLGTEGPLKSAIYSLTFSGLEYVEGEVKRYLLGFDTTTPYNVRILEVEPGYDVIQGGGAGCPRIGDPLIGREKFCNNTACNQKVEMFYNFEAQAHPLPRGVKFNFEVSQFAQNSNTLSDGVTPNPFISTSTQAARADDIEGPTRVDSQAIIGNCALGAGGPGNLKVFPYRAGLFHNVMFLEKGACALAITWFYVEVEVTIPGTGSGTFDSNIVYRRWFKKSPWNECELPDNNPLSEGFNTPSI